MYEVKSKCENLFEINSEVDGFIYSADRNKNIGTTPVGIFTVALTNCALMCVRGYYLKKGDKTVVIESNATLDGFNYVNNIKIAKEVSEDEKLEIIKYINDYCTVSKMLSSEMSIVHKINE